METKIKNPKKEPLLGASLEMLHQESREWQKTIAFWKDETNFFADLLTKKQAAITEYGKVLRNLDKIHETLFDYLAEDIVEHEKNLAGMVASEKGQSDSVYREKHRKLRQRMSVFTEDFKDFKRMVFGYAKKF